MRIQQVDNMSFQAGKVKLHNVKPRVFTNMHELKALAKARNIDIEISREFGNNSLPNFDTFTIFSVKTLKTRTNPDTYRFLTGSGIIIHPKKINKETLSENIYYEALETANIISKKQKNIRKSTKIG